MSWLSFQLQIIFPVLIGQASLNLKCSPLILLFPTRMKQIHPKDVIAILEAELVLLLNISRILTNTQACN
jgi:hypothetical protein